MSITLRPATSNDLHLLNYWNKKPHVIFATGGDSDADDDWLEEQLKSPSDYVWIYIAELDTRPIGVVQLIDAVNEETHYWGDVEQGSMAIDIWIGEETDLGKGYGTEMMKQAIDLCFKDHNTKTILIDSLVINTRAIKFYERLGFEFVENKYFEDDYCAVYVMDRAKWVSIAK